MNYLKLVISVAGRYQESLIAELMEMEFNGFEQQEERIITYVPRGRLSAGDRERIEGILADCPGEGRVESEKVIADRNWNEQWERTIRPQRIGPFLVRPTWSREAATGEAVVLEIDPKMSFGTGYHETTRLMLRALPGLLDEGDRVLDAGTGTGILAIAACKLGASRALSVDIDRWSVTNARENVLLNGVKACVEVRLGSLEAVDEEERFELAMANIERNTIVELLEPMAARLAPGGRLLLSGLLSSDRGAVEEALPAGLQLTGESRENDWIALTARRTGS
ncbi:MAG: 50S ribosomal protein L11 methyltransferase [Balneolaceae bacterium]|nr:50S ribosomal protein L11 methyltransferase [Balneolaceae bacterium]